MKKVVLISTGAVIAGLFAWSLPALAQEKTAKACTEEWRADKANFQAKGVTEKAYVAQCQAGVAPTATAPAPTIAPPPPVARAPDNSAGVKTAKACTEEWRADKANFQAKGITERAYVAACRAGTAPTATAAPGPAGRHGGWGLRPLRPAPKSGGLTKPTKLESGLTECLRAPTTTTAAPPPPAPPPAPTASRPSAEPPYGTTQRRPSTGSPTGAGQYATEAQAKASCLGDTVVWVNLRSKIYHFAGTHNYGNTKDGAYMCERNTTAQGMRAAKNEQHP